MEYLFDVGTIEEEIFKGVGIQVPGEDDEEGDEEEVEEEVEEDVE